MSCLSVRKGCKVLYTSPKRVGITLLVSKSSFENGRYVHKSVFEELDFSKTPYNDMSIHEFGLDAVLAAGGRPDTCFVASSDIDSVLSSVDNLQKHLQNEK